MTDVIVNKKDSLDIWDCQGVSSIRIDHNGYCVYWPILWMVKTAVMIIVTIIIVPIISSDMNEDDLMFAKLGLANLSKLKSLNKLFLLMYVNHMM